MSCVLRRSNSRGERASQKILTLQSSEYETRLLSLHAPGRTHVTRFCSARLPHYSPFLTAQNEPCSLSLTGPQTRVCHARRCLRGVPLPNPGRCEVQMRHCPELDCQDTQTLESFPRVSTRLLCLRRSFYQASRSAAAPSTQGKFRAVPRSVHDRDGRSLFN